VVPLPKMVKMAGKEYSPKLSHVAVGCFAACFGLMAALWTWPAYVTYRGRVRHVSQFCLVRASGSQNPRNRTYVP